MTADIIDFRPKSTKPHFTIAVEQERDSNWHVIVKEFYDHNKPEDQVLLEIAETLIPVAGGLVRTAEAIKPSERGRIVCNISIFDNGHIVFQSDPIDSEERRLWFNDALHRIRTHFIGKKKRRET